MPKVPKVEDEES